MIKSIQVLRALFTVVIFLGHYPSGITLYLQTPSDCALTFFFMLSGFVLSLSHERKVLDGSDRPMHFMLTRVRRFFPLHLFCFLIALPLCLYFHARLSPLTFAANLLLLQSWFPAVSIHFSFNAVSWFLSDLLVAYLLFFPAVKGFARRPQLTYGLLALLIILYTVMVARLHVADPNWAFGIFPPLRILDVVLGVALYQLYKLLRKLGRHRTAAGDLLAPMPIIAALATTCLVPYRFTIACWWWIPAAILIAYFALPVPDKVAATDSENQAGKMRRALIWFGDISFEFYMIHALVILIAVHIFRHFPWITTWIGIPVTFAGSVIAAALIARYLPRITRRLCKR